MIGKRIKVARQELAITQVQLAKMIGITQQSVCDIESGVIEVPRNLEKIAKALKVTQAYLLGEDNGFNPTNKSIISYNMALPILTEIEIMNWFTLGQLPENYRSINMNLPVDFFHDNRKSCLIDITDDSFASHLFNIKLPIKRLIASINKADKAEIFDIILAKLSDNRVKIRQYIKDGNEYFLQSFDPIPEKDDASKSEILGIITGYFYVNAEKA